MRVFCHWKKTRKAFTLSELLVAILILGLVAGATMLVLFVFFENFSQSDELSSARQHAEMVATIMGKPVLSAGLGMPASSSDFNASFSGNPISTNSWNGPIHFDGGTSEGNSVSIVYAVPSGRASRQEYTLSTGGTFTLDLTSASEALASLVTTGNRGKITNWVVFPTLSQPLPAQGTGTDSLTVTALNGGEVSFFDELHFVRATKYSLSTSGEFLEDDEVASGTTKPVARVEGIGGLYFRYDETNETLTMWVLARGNVRHESFVSPSSLPEWAAVSSDIPNADENRHYRLTVLQTSWRVRN